MCTKNFNYERLMGEQLVEQRGIDLDDVGKMDVLDGKMMVYDRNGGLIVDGDVEEFHGAALKGCDECADFTGYCADLTVGSVGSSDEYSSVIVRTEHGLDAWGTNEGRPRLPRPGGTAARSAASSPGTRRRPSTPSNGRSTPTPALHRLRRPRRELRNRTEPHEAGH